MIADILRECRSIVERHHPNTMADLLQRIDEALTVADLGRQMVEDVDLQQIALRAEAPIGTVARVVRETLPIFGDRVEKHALGRAWHILALHRRGMTPIQRAHLRQVVRDHMTAQGIKPASADLYADAIAAKAAGTWPASGAAGGATQMKAGFQVMISDALVRWGADRASADTEALWIAEKIPTDAPATAAPATVVTEAG
jgi:nucleoside phosphorylase